MKCKKNNLFLKVAMICLSLILVPMIWSRFGSAAEDCIALNQTELISYLGNPSICKKDSQGRYIISIGDMILVKQPIEVGKDNILLKSSKAGYGLKVDDYEKGPPYPPTLTVKGKNDLIQGLVIDIKVAATGIFLENENSKLIGNTIYSDNYGIAVSDSVKNAYIHKLIFPDGTVVNSDWANLFCVNIIRAGNKLIKLDMCTNVDMNEDKKDDYIEYWGKKYEGKLLCQYWPLIWLMEGLKIVVENCEGSGGVFDYDNVVCKCPEGLQQGIDYKCKECPDDKVIDKDGNCVSCGKGTVAVEGKCIPGDCLKDGNCSGGKICKDYKCVEPPPECTEDKDCKDSKVCVNGVCVEPPECAKDEDCEFGKECKDGKCAVKQCEADQDCPDGYCDTADKVCMACADVEGVGRVCQDGSEVNVVSGLCEDGRVPVCPVNSEELKACDNICVCKGGYFTEDGKTCIYTLTSRVCPIGQDVDRETQACIEKVIVPAKGKGGCSLIR